MRCIARCAVSALMALALVPAQAEDVARTAHPAGHIARRCLDQKERRAANETVKLIRLAAAMHAAKKRMPGTVVRALLCHGKDGLVYVLTILARDGKVARLKVDAIKGTLVGKL